MKKIIKSLWAGPLVWVALCTALFSFSARPGAHHFQVYIDDKLVIEQYAGEKMMAPRLPLEASANELVVKYSECGRTVSGRAMTIRDEKNNVLKEWKFEGETSGYKDGMSCKVKDIFALKQNGSNTLKLFYSSKEFPGGQQVALLVLSGDSKTASNK